MLPFQTILFATDLSDRAKGAGRLARIIARDAGARLVVAHVVEATHVAESAVLYTEMPLLDPTPLATGRAHLEARARRLEELYAGDPALRVEVRVVEGDPADEILRLADECGCDLIALGTHGRSGLGRLLMGSVAESVLRRAKCPVLTVKQPSPSQAPEPEARATGIARP
jgi:universal stress protein A